MGREPFLSPGDWWPCGLDRQELWGEVGGGLWALHRNILLYGCYTAVTTSDTTANWLAAEKEKAEV